MVFHFREYCLRTPMVVSVYYSILSLLHMMSVALYFGEKGRFNGLDLIISAWIMITMAPFSHLVYYGCKKRKYYFLIVALVMLIVFMASNIFLLVKLLQEIKDRDIFLDVKFMTTAFIAIVHIVFLLFPFLSLSYNIHIMRDEKIRSKAGAAPHPVKN